jgi:VanZ family protein
LIFFLSSIPKISKGGNPVFSFLFFKSLHLIEYGVLFLLTRRALSHYLRPPHKKIRFGFLSLSISPALVSFLFVLLYGASDEFHQTWVPSRQGRPRDVMIDGLGGLLAWWKGIRNGG